MSHCAAQLGLAHSTIKTYLCGICNTYIEAGHPNPSAPYGQHLARLKLVLNGIKKSQPCSSKVRLPITTPIMHAIFSLLHGRFTNNYIDKLMKAACSLAFFGFLRCGEFTINNDKFDPTGNVTLSDLAIISKDSLPNEMHLLLKTSKTDPFRKGVIVKYFRTGGPLCPLTAMTQYLAARNYISREPLLPLFLLPDGKPLSRGYFISTLRSALTALGYNSSSYSGHSFRIGAATSAARCQLPDHLIQTLGRWSSDCYRVYIRTSSNTLCHAQHQLAHNSSA